MGCDAPYGPFDPWAVMSSATTRRTRSGQVLGRRERLSPRQALADYPGAAARRLRPGTPADLVLLGASLHEVMRYLDADLVRLSVIGGRIQTESAIL